jgi:hypothetical protein
VFVKIKIFVCPFKLIFDNCVWIKFCLTKISTEQVIVNFVVVLIGAPITSTPNEIESDRQIVTNIKTLSIDVFSMNLWSHSSYMFRQENVFYISICEIWRTTFHGKLFDF